MAEGQGQPDEARVLSRLAFGEIADAVGGIRGVHRVIAGRAFALAGAGARPAQVGHDAIACAVYASVRGATLLAGAGADVALAARPAPARPLSETPRGGAVLGVLNGLRGDTLDPGLRAETSVRVHGAAVACEPDALRAAFPEPTGRLVVFVHGLMESERAWRRGSGADREWYGRGLARDLGFTPIEVRYNSGLHVSENGRSLAALLDDLVAAWPVVVEQIALVGHSMGGLVARSACCVADRDGAAWVRRVRHVVSIGSPHAGAPLASVVHYAGAALHAVPETRPLGRFLRRASAGIRDLRHGSLVDEDWQGRDPHALRAAVCAEVPLLDGATHCFVAATITHSPRHPVGRVLGDALVLQPSASGRGRDRRIPFQAEHALHVGGTHHLALVNHPAVYEKLADWLATPPPAA